MKQEQINNQYPILEQVRQKRERLGFEPLNIDLLRSQSGSLDPHLSHQAQQILRIKWDLTPEQDALHAESRDINEQLSLYSENEVEIMLKNIVAIQLTEGCNGLCPFCMFGKKKGVTAKYSFDSLQLFLQNNTPLLKNNSLFFYWDSDPFDYRDGIYNFVDVFKLYRQTISPRYHYISTALPQGGTSDFIDFISYISGVYRDQGDNIMTVPVRLSLAQHNIQRIESTLIALTQRLLGEGYLPEEINKIYGKVLTTVDRLRLEDSLLPLGPFVHRSDIIRDTYSNACRDGVVIAPHGNKAVMMTAATIYEPSGEKDVELHPGQVEQFTPIKVREEHHATFRLGSKTMTARTQLNQTMLPVIMHPDGNRFSLLDQFSNTNLALGREVATLTRLINDFSRIAWIGVDTNDALKARMSFIKTASETYKNRREYIVNLIGSAEKYSSENTLTKDKREQLEYYTLLTKVYTEEMDFLVSQVERGQSITNISIIATILRQVSRNQVNQLPNILETLAQIGDEKDIIASYEHLERSRIRQFFRDKFSTMTDEQTFDLPTLNSWLASL